jgi:hypothetical protein
MLINMTYQNLTEKDIQAQGFSHIDNFAEGCKIYGKDNLRLFIGQEGRVTLEYEMRK